MKKNSIITAVCSIIMAGFAGNTEAADKGSFSVDRFADFALHTYASNDPMADVSFIVEGKNSLVIIEPQAFEGHVEEFLSYTAGLGKPVERVLVSFHAAGLKVYKNVCKVITGPMKQFMDSAAGKGMLLYFDEVFKGTIDTEIVDFDEELEIPGEFEIDGVEYVLEPASVPGMPGVNISIGGKVYYQHFAPAKGMHASRNFITSRAAVDGALIDAEKAEKAGYRLFLGSHGAGRAGKEDNAFQIGYYRDMQEVAENSQSAAEFIAGMNRKYSGLQGAEELQAIADNIYKK